MIEIDPNTTVTERFLKFFKELHLKKQPNLNELVISVQNYCEQLNSGRVKYLRDKILLISENIDSKSLDLEHKKLFDLRKLNVLLDNIEGLTFGPNLSQGDRSLILVSDNNFQTIQKTQILAFRLKMESPLLRLLRRLYLR